MKPEFDWRKSDVYPNIPLSPDSSQKPKLQKSIGEQFPKLSALRDELALKETEREEIFSSIIIISIDNATPPDYYLDLVRKYPHEFDYHIRKFFTKLA